MSKLNIFSLLTISVLLKGNSVVRKIPSGDIDTFARIFALKKVYALGVARTLQMFLNPISSIRYFEFNFVRKNLPSKKNYSILDISSPRLFGFFWAYKNKKVSYTMINPDTADIKETQIQLKSLNLPNFVLKNENALRLPYKNETFDVVISISVIEHISGKGDSQSVKEMYRVLKPGGRLIITTHVIKKHRDENRNIDQYGLGRKKSRGKYFFQRMYDNKTLKNRVISKINQKPISQEIIGEKTPGWFDEYIKRWIKYGISETVYDPWHTLTKFKTFKSIDDLPGVGVIELVFQKPQI